MLSRPRDYLMEELRKAERLLIRSKKLRNQKNVEYLRARIAELQEEMSRS